VLTEGGGSMRTYNVVNDHTLTLQNGRNKAADKIIHEKTTGGKSHCESGAYRLDVRYQIGKIKISFIMRWQTSALGAL